MSKAVGLLALLTLLAPLAAAAADAPGVPADPLAPKIAAGAKVVGAAVASGASAAADAAASAGGAIADAAKAAGRALVALAKGVGNALGAVAGAIGAGLAAIASSFALIGRSLFGFVRDHPRETAIAAGTTGGLAAFYALAKRFGALLFLPLYTRLAPSEMLDNKARASVYEHVRAHPGAHPSAIAETLGLGWGTVVYHLARLEDSKLVVAKSAHHRKCYFVVGGDMNADARAAVAAMTHDKAKLIVAAVRGSPGISQKDLAAKVGMSQALASWHVKRLVESGVLTATRSGRSNALSVAAHVPVVGETAPVAVAA